MALGVCSGHVPSQDQPYGFPTVQHAWTFWEKGQRQRCGESCCDLCKVPGGEDTGVDPASREGEQMTMRYFQEKQGEEKHIVLDTSKVEDALGRQYWLCFSVVS